MPEDRPNPPDLPDIRTEAGFEAFLRQTQNQIRRFLTGRGLLPKDAEDLAQEAYLALWKRRHEVRNPRTFLLGIAKTLAQAHYRKAFRLDLVPLDESVQGITIPETAAPETAVPPFFRQGLDKLPPRQREVLELVWLQNHTRPQAATMLGITPSTLRSHEQQAFRALKKMSEN